jgi:hypothetical protein
MPRLYKKTPFHIGTARFNNKTYLENQTWKERKEWNGCIYGFDKKIPININNNDYIFIIEMNNDENKIMGIGLIQNIYKPSNRTRIYHSHTWNRYVYKGINHISRENILNLKKGSEIIKLLEIILFYGYNHFKRGQGCSILNFDRIATCQNVRKPEKREYRCKKCGLPKKGHICSQQVIKKIKENKKCPKCGKTKKGHICEAIKKDFQLLDIVCKFFTNLFI